MVTIKELADKQFKTISNKDKKRLGITKTNFRKDFAIELKELRTQAKKRSIARRKRNIKAGFRLRPKRR